MPTVGALWIFASKGSHSPALSLHGHVGGKWASGSHFQQLVSSSVQRVAGTASQRCLKEPGREVSRERRGVRASPGLGRVVVEQELGRTGVEASTLLCCATVSQAARCLLWSVWLWSCCVPQKTQQGHPKGAKVLCKGKAKHQLASSAQHPKTT